MLTRRTLLHSSSLVAIGSAIFPRTLFAARFATLPESLAQLEKDATGRLGIAILDTATGEVTGHRTTERFAMCSTFKMLLAATVLCRVDTGKEDLNRTLRMPAEFLSNSPLTRERAGANMTIRDICAAAITRSDNTATNLLLESIGGPSGITKFARSLDDQITRLDRIETALNESRPGDPRDTTAPASMAANWNKLLLGNKLKPASRKQLTDWLIANQTGDDRLRAGLPKTWAVGDKTGSNGETTTNDVAIFWPANQAPIIVAAYLTECPGTDEKRNAVIAQVGKLVAKAISPA